MITFRFGDFEFEPAESRLKKGDAIVHAQPKVLDALAFFLERSGQLATRDDILDALWPDVIVNEEALTQTIRKLRRALSDSPRDPRYLETVPKRGYRFIADVERSDRSGAGPMVSVPGWVEGGAAPAIEPRGGTLGVNDLDHLRQLLGGGARLVMADRYVLISRVGVDAGNTVYQARDLVSLALVRLKLLFQPDPDDVVRFRREARLLAELEHPGIVPYAAHGTTSSGLCFLATEWIDGELLTDWLVGRGPLDRVSFASLAGRLARTLGYAHDHNIIHRDLTPANLIVPDDDGGSAKILDFGLARCADEAPMTAAGELLGTVGFISPEQVRGTSDLDARTDVYALGCLFYTALTGRPPFAGSPMEIMRALVMEPPPRVSASRPGIDPELDELVWSMMAQEREHRPADGAAVASALDELP